MGSITRLTYSTQNKHESVTNDIESHSPPKAFTLNIVTNFQDEEVLGF